MNKISIRRFETPLPIVGEGILKVSEEGKLFYDNFSALRKTIFRDNTTIGFKPSLNNNVFTFSKGEIIASKRNKISNEIIQYPFYGLLSQHQFNSIGKQFTPKDDESEIEQTFQGNNQISVPNDKTIRPTKIIISEVYHAIDVDEYEYVSSNKVVGMTKYIGSKTNVIVPKIYTAKYEYEIYGSMVKHPYDSLDWKYIGKADNMSEKTIETSLKFRHIKIHNITTNDDTKCSFKITGYSTYGSSYKKYFVAYEENGTVYEDIYNSLNRIVLPQEKTLIDFYPIYENENYNIVNMIDDYDNSYSISSEGMSIDISNKLSMGRHYIWFVTNGLDNHLEIDKIPNDYAGKLICWYESNGINVTSYAPFDDLNKTYENEFKYIIKDM